MCLTSPLVHRKFATIERLLQLSIWILSLPVIRDQITLITVCPFGGWKLLKTNVYQTKMITDPQNCSYRSVNLELVLSFCKPRTGES